MALRLYLSPTEQVNGYAGVPRSTQVFASTLGPPSNNGNYVDLGGVWGYFCTPGSGRILPVHPFTATKPGVGERTTISINEAQGLITRPAGGTTYYKVWSPLCIGAMRITEALTVDPADWISAGTAGRWSWQFRTENWDNGVTYEAGINLIPAIAYIWRPSTASMVGTLWDVLAQNPYAIGTWGLGTNNVYETSSDWSERWNYVTGYQDFYRGAYNSAPVWESGAVTAWATVAAEADDVMCVEYWYFSSRATTATAGTGQKVSMSIGGGTDATLDATHSNSSPQNDGTTPIHNTFMESPTLDAISFPTDVPLPLSSGSNLISVTPGTGPTLRLGFDTATGITGPTIGPAVAGLGVLSATQIDTTHIDLACAIRPDHPDGAADNTTLTPPIGEADNLGPPVPTGFGATVI